MARNTSDWDYLSMDSSQSDGDGRVVKWQVSYSVHRRALKYISDFGLGAAGAGMALASAVFALVMISSNIKEPVGNSEYLLLFTRPLHTPGMPSPQIAPGSRDIDYTVTGTIGPLPRSDKAADQPVATPSGPKLPLKNYVLRSVRGGVATILGPTGHFIVESGGLMPNGDQVLSIDRRGGRWVVVTSSGIIEDQ
jgi:hypothetical protein